MVNSKIGEVYILGQRKGHKKQTKIIEISSKKDGEISFINLEEKTYINARELINLNAISKSSNLKEIENIRFVFLVAKKWPELNQNTLNFKNVNYFYLNNNNFFLFNS